MNKNYIEVSLIELKGKPNKVLENILDSINTYLIRNKNNVSDFNIIKDVVERNCEAVDEEINAQMPIPLFLGLMGTMLGIIIGLLFIPSIDNFTGSNFSEGTKVKVIQDNKSAIIHRELEDNTLEIRFSDGTLRSVHPEEIKQTIGVDILLSGVKIAMFSSFIGLLLTIIATGWVYKGAKVKLGVEKNGFYTFVQTELMPVLASDTATVIRTLEQNLNKFNSEFGNNAKQFNLSFSSFTGSIKDITTISEEFKSLLGEIRKLNLLKLSKVNSELLEKISVNAQGLDRFNDYLKQIDGFVENALRLNSTLSEQLQRTNSIEAIAKTISNNVEQNDKVINYLEAGLMEIDSRKQVISDAVISVDKQIQKSLDALEEHTQESIQAIRNIKIKEEDLLEKLLKEDRGNLDKLKNLDPIKVSLEKLIENTQRQNTGIGELKAAIGSIKTTKKDPETLPVLQIPQSLKVLAYAFLGAGATIGLVKIIQWSIQAFSFLAKLF